MMLCKNFIQVALILHGFTLRVPHFTQGLLFFRMNSHYVIGLGRAEARPEIWPAGHCF